jgi:hypothetical protein
LGSFTKLFCSFSSKHVINLTHIYKDEAPSPPIASSTHGLFVIHTAIGHLACLSPAADQPSPAAADALHKHNARPPAGVLHPQLVISLARVVILATTTLAAQLLRPRPRLRCSVPLRLVAQAALCVAWTLSWLLHAWHLSGSAFNLSLQPSHFLFVVCSGKFVNETKQNFTFLKNRLWPGYVPR